MEKLLVIVLLKQVFSYNLLNLGSDLGIFRLEPIIEKYPAAKYYKLIIKDIKLLNQEKSQVLNIFICYNDTEIERILDITSKSKMMKLYKASSSTSECIVYFFMLRSITYLQNPKLIDIYYDLHHKLENIYLENCNSRSYSQALALFRYFSQNTEKEKFINYVTAISSMFNFNKINESNSQYHTEIKISTHLEYQAYNFKEIFICWVEFLLYYKFPFTKNILDQFLKSLDIKKPDCELYGDYIEEIIQMYFKDAYESFKDCKDYLVLLKKIADLYEIDFSKYAWDAAGLIKDGIMILMWPLDYIPFL